MDSPTISMARQRRIDAQFCGAPRLAPAPIGLVGKALGRRNDSGDAVAAGEGEVAGIERHDSPGWPDLVARSIDIGIVSMAGWPRSRSTSVPGSIGCRCMCSRLSAKLPAMEQLMCSAIGDTHLKVVCWDGNGVWMCVRRLHRGHFVWPQAGDTSWELSAEQWQWLVAGVDWQRLSAPAPAAWKL